MARIEFPKGLEGSENLPRTRKLLQNCFWTQDTTGVVSIIQRPGINELNDTNGRVARGSFVWNKSLYMVFSQDLIRILDPNTGTFEVIGEIDGRAEIDTAIGFEFATIIVKGGKGYTLSKSTVFLNIDEVQDNSGVASFIHDEEGKDIPRLGNLVTLKNFINNPSYNVTGIVTAATDTSFEVGAIVFGSDEQNVGSYTITLAEIISAQFAPSVSVANINEITVYIPEDGSQAFFSDVGAPGFINPLSFFDAEELPDENNAVFNFRNTLYIMGTNSIQPFRFTTALPNPFVPIQGGRILNGFIGGLLEYNNSFLFIGREKDQDFGIYALGPGIAPKISNEAIDLILSTYTQDELKEVIPGRFKWRGFDIATFTLARDSFGFLKGNWFKLDTVFDNESKPWGAGFITQFEGQYYTAFNDKIGRFEKINTDYGNRITRIMDTSLTQVDTEFFPVQSIELGIAQGFNKSEGSVALLLSNDNVLYGPPLYRQLGNIGQYNQKLVWNYAGGLGTYHGFLGIRFFTTEAIDFTDDYITANLRGGG